MSGGHWDRAGFKLQDLLETIAEDTEVKARWPFIAEVLAGLGPWLYGVERDMDWDLSGDRSVCSGPPSYEPDDEKFQLEQLRKLLDLLGPSLRKHLKTVGGQGGSLRRSPRAMQYEAVTKMQLEAAEELRDVAGDDWPDSPMREAIKKYDRVVHGGRRSR